MTIFGPDISSYEAGVNVASLSDPFVMLKCTEGTYYADAYYAGWLAQAKQSHKLVVAYHFVSTHQTAQAQAAWLGQHIIDKAVPVMLDIEPEGDSKPSLGLVLDLVKAINALGMRVKLAYFPKWYWEQVGSPKLTPLADLGVGLVSSAYPHPGTIQPVSGYQADGGDGGTGWGAYGGVSPIMWQFTDAGLEQKPLDFNAFKGTTAQLAAFLNGGAAPTTQGGVDVTPEEHSWLTNLYSGMFYGGSSCGAVVPAGHPGAGSNALFAHIGYMTSLLEGMASQPAPTVDVAALAAQIVAAIEQHLPTGTDAQAVAVAVQAQLATALSGHGVG